MTASIERADTPAAAAITRLTSELLEEVQAAIGERVFRFDAAHNRARLAAALAAGRCIVFPARTRTLDVSPWVWWRCAMASRSTPRVATASRACSYGIITEFDVRPIHRGRGLGAALPAFEHTLAFYEREGFAVSGGWKLRCLIGGTGRP